MAEVPWRRVAAGFKFARARNSAVHGRGLFARRDIPAGTPVIEYLGRKLTKKQSNDLTTDQWDRGLVYTFTLNKRYDLDGDVWWNRARYANHSCDPNCEAELRRGQIWIMALRDIKKGDELTYDYNFPADGELHPCRCTTRKCSGYVVGKASRGALKRRLVREGIA